MCKRMEINKGFVDGNVPNCVFTEGH